MLDLVEPDVEYSLSDYLAAAHRALEEVRARGRTPIFVGGTGLYLKGLLRGVFAGPPADWELRRELDAFADQAGSEALHSRLAEVDPQAAARLHPRDRRRVIRALEVWTKTGRPISEWQQQFDRPAPAEKCRAFYLHWPRATLAARIDARVDAMFAAGLLEEASRLLRASTPPGRTARQALGYREIFESLEGARDIASTIALIKTRTRQFAKRQGVWFRSLAELRPIPVDEPFEAARVAEAILSAAQEPTGP